MNKHDHQKRWGWTSLKRNPFLILYICGFHSQSWIKNVWQLRAGKRIVGSVPSALICNSLLPWRHWAQCEPHAGSPHTAWELPQHPVCYGWPYPQSSAWDKKQWLHKSRSTTQTHFLWRVSGEGLTCQDKRRRACGRVPSSAQWGRALSAAQELRQTAEGRTRRPLSSQLLCPDPSWGPQAPPALSVSQRTTTRVNNI